LILPADIPLVTAREIHTFLKSSDGHSFAITPSKDGSGTNALFLRPPRIIRPCFGRNSFRRHTAAATQKGLEAKVIKLRGISVDVDEPQDLARLKRSSPRSETGRLLRLVGRGQEIKV
jgi:2-phospho-L-lactate guanylyltransferase